MGNKGTLIEVKMMDKKQKRFQQNKQKTINLQLAIINVELTCFQSKN
jgi:hypothetical protein